MRPTDFRGLDFGSAGRRHDLDSAPDADPEPWWQKADRLQGTGGVSAPGEAAPGASTPAPAPVAAPVEKPWWERAAEIQSVPAPGAVHPPRPMQVGAPRPAPLVPEPEPERPRTVVDDLKLGAKALVTGATKAVADIAPQTIGGAIEGTDVPLRDDRWLSRMIADQKKDAQARGLTDAERERKVFGVKAGTLESGAESGGYSLAIMGPQYAAQVAGGALGSLVSPGVGTAAGVAAGAGVGYAIASRADMNQVLREKRDQLLAVNPDMTEQEWEGVKTQVSDAVQKHGQAEGGWEAAGNALQLAIMGLGAKWGVGRPIIQKIAAIGTSAVADIPLEVATEAKTQQAQAEAEREMGLRDPGTPLTFLEAVGEVGPQTLVTTLLTMGIGGTAAQVGKGIQHGRFVQNKPNMVQGLEAIGVRPEVVERVNQAQTYDAYQQAIRENSLEIVTDSAIATDFQNVSDPQAEQILAEWKARNPEYRQVQPLGRADPRDAIRAIVEIQRGLAPGALRPTAQEPVQAAGEPGQPAAAAETPAAAPAPAPGDAPQAPTEVNPIRGAVDGYGSEGDQDNAAAFEEIAVGIKAELAGGTLAAPDVSPIEQDLSPVPTPEPPLSAPAVPLAMPDLPQPVPAREAVSGPEGGASRPDAMPPISVGAGPFSAPVAPPQESGVRSQESEGNPPAEVAPESPVARPGAETAQGVGGAKIVGGTRGQAAGAAIPAKRPNAAAVRKMTRKQAVALAAAEGVRGPNEGAGDPWAGYTAKDVQDRILKARKGAEQPLPAKAVPVKPEQPEVGSPQRAQRPQRSEEKPPELMTPEEFAKTVPEPYQAAKDVWRIKLGDENRAFSSKEDAVKNAPTKFHRSWTREAMDEKKPVSADAVEAYGLTPPTGYVRQGDRYVYLSASPAATDGKTTPQQEPLDAQADRGPAAEKPTPLRKGQAVRYKGEDYFVSGMPRLLKKQGIVEITRKGGGEPKAVRAELLEVVDAEERVKKLREQAAKVLVDTRGFDPADAADYAAKLGNEKELEGFLADNTPEALAELEKESSTVEVNPQGVEAGTGRGVAAEPGFASGMDLRPGTGQSKPVPGIANAEYNVYFRKANSFDERKFRAVITNNDPEYGGRVAVDGKGMSGEEAYREALGEYLRKMDERRNDAEQRRAAAMKPMEPAKTEQPMDDKAPGAKSIGTNPAGYEILEDENGVRSFTLNGVKHIQSVRMRPTKGGGMEVSAKSPEAMAADGDFSYLTTEEIQKAGGTPVQPLTETPAGDTVKIEEGAANGQLLDRPGAGTPEGRREDQPDRAADRSGVAEPVSGAVSGIPGEGDAASVPAGGTARRGGDDGGSGSAEGAAVAGGEPGDSGIAGGAGKSGLEPDSAGEAGGRGRGNDGAVRSGDGSVPAKPAVAPAEKSQANGSNWIIQDLDYIEAGGDKSKYRDNVAAIRVLKALAAEQRRATPEEQAILSKYVGWGRSAYSENLFSSYGYSEAFRKWEKEREELKALLTDEEFESARASTINAHWTHPRIAAGMWRMLERMGFRGGKVHENSIGAGIFFGTMPVDIRDRSSLSAGDMDSLAAQLSQALYPGAKVTQTPFQEAPLPENFFDTIIGNFPFGDITIRPDKFNKIAANLHDYFFLKSVAITRPGGIVAAITSTGTLDKMNPRTREVLAEKADLVAAFRLPAGAFQKSSGTDVVTDIIILRRRFDGEAPSDVKWKVLKELPDPDGGDPIAVNEYFADHPENILGTLDRKSKMYSTGNMHVTATPDFAERFEAAIARLPEDVYKLAASRKEAERKAFDSTTGLKDYGHEIRDGKLWQRQGGEMVEVALKKKDDLPKVEAMLDIRRLAVELQAAELADATDANLAVKRKALNRAYDAFTKKYGWLNRRGNASLLKYDPDWPILVSIEDYDDEKETAKKADIFAKRVMKTAVRPDRAQDEKQAIGYSLNETGALDIRRISELLSTDADTAEDKLVGGGYAFRVPGGGLELRDYYLSGNVREKLIQAEAAAKYDSRFRRNAEELRKVIPEDVPHSEIEVRLGSPWIPASDYQDFFAHLLGTDPSDMRAAYLQKTGRWLLTVEDDSLKWRTSFTETYGTPRANFLKVAQAAMDDKAIMIYDVDRDGNKTFNADDSAAANMKVEEVRDLFREWIWADDARRARLHRYYNDTMNNVVETKHDGAWLDFPTMSAAAPKPYPHQQNAVARLMRTRRMLAAHEVGSGKTMMYGMAAAKMKELGYASKPALVVLKANIEQITSEIQRAFPTMRILSTSGEFDAKSRRQTIARIASGDWDLVIMTHDNFNMLDVDQDVEAEFIRDEINELEDVIRASEAMQAESRGGRRGSGKSKDRTTKQLEKMKQSLEEKLKKSLDNPRDPAVTFQRSGIDMLMVDEAHKYKSLPVYTTRGSVKGIPQSRSDRATNMRMHVRWLQRNNPKAVVVFGTGTPIDNSMVELYNWQTYLQPEELEARGIESFDGWANTFGQTVTKIEPTAAGEFKPTTRFKQFTNLKELSTIARQMLDTVFIEDMPWIKRPKRVDSVVNAPLSSQLASFMAGLAKRAKALKGKKVEKGSDNMLAICTDGRKSAIHMGLVTAKPEDGPEGKVNQCVENVLKLHRENPGATQMIFSDIGVNEIESTGFHLYQNVIRKLVAGGIPKDKIIDFTKLKDGEPRETAIKRLRSGDALIGIGSTEKMGTGVNAQTYLKYGHHLDAPLTPGRLEQRVGRFWRQGNTNTEVTNYIYVTEGSLDAFVWSLLNNKASFIRQFLKDGPNRREITETDTEEIPPARVMAIASGNPDVLAAIELDDELTRLVRKQRVFETTRARAISQLDSKRRSLDYTARDIAELESAVADYEKTKGAEFSVEIDGKIYAARDGKLDKAIGAAAEKVDEEVNLFGNRGRIEGRKIGSYKGFDLVAGWTEEDRRDSYRTEKRLGFALKHSGGAGVRLTLTTDPADKTPMLSILRSADGMVRSFAIELERDREAQKGYIDDISKLETLAAKKFDGAEEIARKRMELADIQKRLAKTEKDGDVDIKVAAAEDKMEDLIGPERVSRMREMAATQNWSQDVYLKRLEAELADAEKKLHQDDAQEDEPGTERLAAQNRLAGTPAESRMEDGYGSDEGTGSEGRSDFAAGESGRQPGGGAVRDGAGRKAAAGQVEDLRGIDPGRLDAERIAAKARRRDWGRQVELDDAPEIRGVMDGIRARAVRLGAHVAKAKTQTMGSDGVYLGGGDILIATRNTPAAMNEGADHELVHFLDERADADVRSLRKKINRGSRTWTALREWLVGNYRRNLLDSGLSARDAQGWIDRHVRPDDVDRELVAELARPTTGPGLDLWQAFGALRKPAEQDWQRVRAQLYPPTPAAAPAPARATPAGPTGGQFAASEQAARDREYLAAVERGDTATAQRIVDEAFATSAIAELSRYFDFAQNHTIRKSDPKLAHNKAISSYVSAIRRLYDGLVEMSGNKPNGNILEIGRLVELSEDSFARGDIGKAIQYGEMALQEYHIDAYDSTWRTDYTSKLFSEIEPAVVRDDAGRIIPPSERFNPRSADIRFAAKTAPGTEYDGAKVAEYARKGGGTGWRIVGADGKVLDGGFLSKETAETVLAERTARLGEAMEEIAKENKATVAQIAAARGKMIQSLMIAKEKRVEGIADVLAYLDALKLPKELYGRIRYKLKNIANAVRIGQIGSATEAAIRFADETLTEAAGQLYLKKLNDVLTKKRTIVTETGILKAQPRHAAVSGPILEKALAMSQMRPEAVNARMDELDALSEQAERAENPDVPAPTAEQVHERHLLSVFGGLAHQADYRRARAALDAAERIIRDGATAFMQEEGERQARAEELRTAAIAELKAGREAPANAYARAGEGRSFGQRVAEAARGFWMGHEGGSTFWNQLDNRRGVADKSGRLMEFHGMETAAQNDEFARNERVDADLHAAIARATGIDGMAGRKEAKALRQVLNGWKAVQEQSGVFVRYVQRDEQGNVVGLRRGEQLKNGKTALLYVWLIAKRAEAAARQPFNDAPAEIDGADSSIMRSLVENGYTAETIREIEANVGPRLLDFGRWMVEYLDQHSAPEVRRITERLFGAVPPIEAAYFPIRREHYGRDEDAASLSARGGGVSMARSWMKLRVPNLRDLRESDAIEVFMRHLREVNHVSTHLETVDLENRVMKHQDMQKALAQHMGERARRHVNGHVNVLTTGGVPELFDGGVNALMRKFARSVIPSPTVMLKQTTSYPLMAAFLPPGYGTARWLADVARMHNPMAQREWNARFNREFGYWRQRFGEGWNLQMRIAMKKEGLAEIDQKADFFQFMSNFIRWGDKVACLTGGVGVFKAWRDHYTRLNKSKPKDEQMTDGEIEKAAYAKLQAAIEESQQSGALKDMAAVQTNPIFRMFMMFKTQPLAISRLYMNAIRGIAYQRGDAKSHWRTIAAIHLSQALFQFVADAFWAAALDDDDEWKRLAKNQLRAQLLAPINGYFMLYDVAALALNKGMRLPVYGDFGSDILPWTSVAESAGQSIGRTSRMMTDGIQEGDWWMLLQALGEGAGVALGQPIAPVMRIGQGVVDAATDDTLNPVARPLRAIGYGKKAVGQDRGGGLPDFPAPGPREWRSGLTR